MKTGAQMQTSELDAGIRQNFKPNKSTLFSTQLKWCMENKISEMKPITDAGILFSRTCWVLPGTCGSKTCQEARKLIERENNMSKLPPEEIEKRLRFYLLDLKNRRNKLEAKLEFAYHHNMHEECRVIRGTLDILAGEYVEIHNKVLGEFF
jgi:hypothetical protein